jgi:hypothetical protein
LSKEAFILSFFTLREKRIERLFLDVERKKSLPTRLEKQMVPGTRGVPCGEKHRNFRRNFSRIFSVSTLMLRKSALRDIFLHAPFLSRTCLSEGVLPVRDPC